MQLRLWRAWYGTALGRVRTRRCRANTCKQRRGHEVSAGDTEEGVLKWSHAGFRNVSPTLLSGQTASNGSSWRCCVGSSVIAWSRTRERSIVVSRIDVRVSAFSCQRPGPPWRCYQPGDGRQGSRRAHRPAQEDKKEAGLARWPWLGCLTDQCSERAIYARNVLLVDLACNGRKNRTAVPYVYELARRVDGWIGLDPK